MSFGLEDVVATIRDRSDFSSRLCLAPMEVRAEDDWIGRLLALWEGRRRGALLPARTDFDNVELMAMSRGRSHIVDTTADQPTGYFFRLWGSTVSLDRGADYTKMRLGSMPHTTMRDAALEDYADVVATGVPAYQLVHHLQGFMPYSYARLLLPLATNGRQVDQVLVSINERDIPELLPDLARHARPHIHVVSGRH